MASSPDNVITGSNAPDDLGDFHDQNDSIVGYDPVEGDIGVDDGDRIESDGGQDTAIGGSGNDTIIFNSNDHALMDGGTGDDSLVYNIDSVGESTISGGNGNDNVFVTGHGDGLNIDLGDGNDVLESDGSLDHSTISGGLGDD